MLMLLHPMQEKVNQTIFPSGEKIDRTNFGTAIQSNVLRRVNLLFEFSSLFDWLAERFCALFVVLFTWVQIPAEDNFWWKTIQGVCGVKG